MKILHVVPTYLPAVRYGGPIFAVHGVARALAARGHQVHVFTTNVDGQGVSDVQTDRPVDLDGVTVHYFPSPLFRRLYYSSELRGECRRRVADFDIAHLHSVFLHPTLAAARAATRAGVPYVISPRGMLVRDLIARRSPILKRAWIAAFERTNLANAAAIHVTSINEERALLDLGLGLAPTAVIGNGVDQPRSYHPDILTDDVSEVCRRGFDILSFGRISWKKGLEALVSALASMPEVRAVIAGNDEDGFTSRLRDLAKSCGVADRLTFLPRHVDGADKEALFATARVFALPSLSENFGNVVVEALIRGTPVAVTEGVGAADIVLASGGGLVTRHNDEEFASALRKLLTSTSDAHLNAMGAAGKAYVRKNLSWERVAAQFEELYSLIHHRCTDRQGLRRKLKAA